jgi:hypothetical protein
VLIVYNIGNLLIREIIVRVRGNDHGNENGVWCQGGFFRNRFGGSLEGFGLGSCVFGRKFAVQKEVVAAFLSERPVVILVSVLVTLVSIPGPVVTVRLSVRGIVGVVVAPGILRPGVNFMNLFLPKFTD